MKDHVENSRFLRTLAEFYGSCSEKGSVWVTMKQVPGPADESGVPSKVCQVRAKMGREDVHPNTISTIVQPRNVVAFSADLSAVLNERCQF